MTAKSPKKKSTKSKTSKAKKVESKSFLLKRDDRFYMVPSSVIATLSADEAFRLGITAVMEQRKQLLADALEGDHYINNVKVVDGLEASLQKLDELFPSLRAHIDNIDLTQISNRIGQC